MKRMVLTSLALIVSFFPGFEMRTILPLEQQYSSRMRKAIRNVGIFFKCKDPEKTKEWYSIHLGLKIAQ